MTIRLMPLPTLPTVTLTPASPTFRRTTSVHRQGACADARGAPPGHALVAPPHILDVLGGVDKCVHDYTFFKGTRRIVEGTDYDRVRLCDLPDPRASVYWLSTVPTANGGAGYWAWRRLGRRPSPTRTATTTTTLPRLSRPASIDERKSRMRSRWRCFNATPTANARGPLGRATGWNGCRATRTHDPKRWQGSSGCWRARR